MLFMKICFTMLFIMLFVLLGGLTLMIVDNKREDLWIKVTITGGISVGVISLIMIGVPLYLIWFN